MRNIEDLAAEEGAREWEVTVGRFRGFSQFLGMVGSGWGWYLFEQGQMPKGALVIVLSLVLFFSAWGGLKVLPRNFFAAVAGLLVGGGAFVLYHLTRVPFFFWGADPAFCLAAHGGAVGEPPWSPLAVLLGQAATALFPQRPFFILPEVSSAILALALFFALQDLFSQLRNQTALNLGLASLICGCAAVSLPLWNAGTLPSGLISGSGLILFLFQRALLGLEERPWKALCLLLGLLMSVHPLWGLLGLVNHLSSLDMEGKDWRGQAFPFLLGFTPFLWIFFRAGDFFPSWGGPHPFREMFVEGESLWSRHFQKDWSLPQALWSLGWVACAMLGLMFLLTVLYFAKWRTGNKRSFPMLDLWIWVLACAGSVFFYSSSSGILGCLAPWVILGAGGTLLRLAEKGVEKRHGGWSSGTPLAIWVVVGTVGAAALLMLPGQSCSRASFYFPQQHATNLLRTLEKRSILICEDPFEGAACLEARLQDPIALSALILDEGNMGQRWYVSQCMTQSPELLFSKVTGASEDVLKALIRDNHDDWAIHWSRARLPANWNGPKAFSTVLTQEFEGKAAAPVDPMTFQYRYDLTFLPLDHKGLERGTELYYSRYPEGFCELGKNLFASQRYTDSIHSFERAAKIDPTYKEPRDWLAKIYSQKNILEAAKMDFEKLVKTGPERKQELMAGIDQAKKAQNEAKAAILLDELVRLDTALAGAQYQLSKIYDREGRSQEAKAYLEASLRSDPQQLEAQMALGHLMLRLGNRAKAQEAFRAVLGIDPQNKEAQIEIWKLLNK